MEKQKFDREKFWGNCGTEKEELSSWLQKNEKSEDKILTIGDQFFTLICC